MLPMNMPQLSLVHLQRQPETDTPDPIKPPMIILLHGVRSNEQDLFALTPYIDERFIVISARAPLTLGRNQFGWYNVAFYPDRIERNAAELEQSRRLLIQFIKEAIVAYDADPKRVYLMGFSQGSIMSVAVMLTQPELLAGIVVQSGSLPTEVLPDVAARERFNKFPVLVVHGTDDNVLSIDEAHTLQDYLQTLPVDLEYREYPMRHQISDQSLDDVCGWLVNQLNRG